MQTIKEVLMKRDGLTGKQAQTLIDQAREELSELLDAGEIPQDFCLEWFGLEDDYIFDILF